MKSCFHYNYDYWGYHGKKIIKTRGKRKGFFLFFLSELSPVPGQFSGPKINAFFLLNCLHRLRIKYLQQLIKIYVVAGFYNYLFSLGNNLSSC